MFVPCLLSMCCKEYCVILDYIVMGFICDISTALHKTVVTPLHQQWSYHCLVLSH